MEDNYFDKKLKGILGSAPEVQPDSAAIEDMRKKLKTIPKPAKRRNGLLFLIPLLLLPILLGAGFAFKKYDDLHQQVLNLNQEMIILKSTVQRDTILQQQIIQQYDTIYTVVYREKYIKAEPHKISYLLTGFQSPIYFSDYERSSILNTKNNLNWSLGSNKKSLFTREPGSSIFNVPSLGEEQSNAQLIDTYATSPINTLGLQYLNIEQRKDPDWVIDLADNIPEMEEAEINPAYYFVPSGFVLDAGTSPYVFLRNAFGSQGKIYGIGGAIRFPRGRSLRLGAEWLNTSFEVKDEEPDFYNQFPILNPTDPADVLHEVKGSFNYLQIPVTLRQSFGGNNLKPFIDMGFVAYRPLARNFVYEYINLSGEYKLNNSVNGGVFSVDNLRFGLGAEYSIGRKFAAVAEVQYQHGFSQSASEYHKLQSLGFRLGLQYTVK